MIIEAMSSKLVYQQVGKKQKSVKARILIMRTSPIAGYTSYPVVN